MALLSKVGGLALAMGFAVGALLATEVPHFFFEYDVFVPVPVGNCEL